MTRSKKKVPANLNLNNKENANLKDVGFGTSKVPTTAKYGAFKTNTSKPSTIAVAPKDQLGLLVTDELQKAMDECRTKVKQIVRGCRAANRRFRDIEFDLENDKLRCLKGLNYNGSDVPPGVLRVTQIFDKPCFVIDGTDAVDIIQGRLGDCWFLSALSTMSTSKGLIEKLCVERDEEVGVYGFVFFRASHWVSIIIDDQLFWSLPKYEELSFQEQELYRGDRETYNKLARKGGKGLYFSRSGTEGETWVPLIEKAFAKLHGDYQSLEGGLASEAIEDMTGGVSVMYRTMDILNRDRFWKDELLHATQDRLFGCSFAGLDTSRKNEIVLEAPKVNGLLGSHAYSILRVKECKGKRFVVIRNPWGASEWTGAWGDGSKEWVGEWLDVLKELDHVFGDDGEFVMEYSDFLDTFELIERTTIFDSSWVMSSHWLRVPPQRPNCPWTFGDLSFSFTLSKPSFTIISLSQLDSRYFEPISGVSKWNIDFVVYKRGDKEITGVSYYAVVTCRSVTCELKLEAGEYIVYPRYDRYPSEDPGYFEEKLADWNPRKLTRVLTERAKARSIAVNLKEGADKMYFPKSIEELIEEDQKLLDAEKNDDGNGDWQDEDEDEDEDEGGEGKAKEAEGNGEKPEDAEGDQDNGSMKPPGSEDDEEPRDYFNDEDLDPIILGLRIYTPGGAVVSATGQVIGEDDDDDESEGDEDVKSKPKSKSKKSKVLEDKKED